MGQDCEKFIGMALKSVQEADEIVYCDGESKAKFFMHFQALDIRKKIDNKFKLIQQEYNQEDLGMNGKQRNFYLDYVKKNYPDDWCLAIDCDEVVENLDAIKRFIQTATPAVYSVKMRHLIQDLAHEDATQETHLVLHRLFKISKADKYPETEHRIVGSIIDTHQ